MSEMLDDTGHPVSLESPLGGGLVVRSMSGDEALGGLFTYTLELLSHDFELQFDQVVGQPVTVALDLPEEKRFFNGYITEFHYLGQTDRYARYQAILRPWLWFLTRTSDCKIFQEKTVPDIIKDVFRENGMSDFADRLNGSYRRWEYCVQYGETDFNFVSRLMEQEGIYYFFEHQQDKHVLVLADNMSAHNPFPQYETVPYFTSSPGMSVQERDHLQYWAVTQNIQPEHYATQDFDFKHPGKNLLVKLMRPGKHAYPIENSEIYDYPGEYTESAAGENYVDIRLQELRSQSERVNAGGPCRGMSAGCRFKLEDYPREDQNKEYLVLSVSHQINDSSYISSSRGGAEELYDCQIEVMDIGTTYRQVRSTPKPVIQGPQTAIVVGPDNEEIFTDEFSRVKVQFHWDRYGLRDENSSCWVRVSQLWAGTKWGGIHIPRIGQEVIVSFMEGDPDKPVITGRVYNADCMPPYTLEQSKTQSGIKSRSSKGGGQDNFNEIRMEDKTGEEELHIQAEKDENILVKNNKGEKVGNDETISIGNDREETVGHDENLGVSNNRSRNVGANESITIGVDQSIQVKKNQSVAVDKNRALVIGKDLSVTTGDDEIRKTGKKLVIDAGDSILIKCGAASISLKKNGDIKIDGKSLVLKASAKINVKASGTVTIKGSKILEN